MVRIATEKDAEQLEFLNNEFNGEGETTLENIRLSLADNKQEVIVVDEQNGELIGFLCVQLKKSFAQTAYKKFGYCEDEEMHMAKRIKRCK